MDLRDGPKRRKKEDEGGKRGRVEEGPPQAKDKERYLMGWDVSTQGAKRQNRVEGLSGSSFIESGNCAFSFHFSSSDIRFCLDYLLFSDIDPPSRGNSANRPPLPPHPRSAMSELEQTLLQCQQPG